MPEPTTETLALFASLYMLAAGIGLLVDPKGYSAMIDEFRANGAVTYLAAMMAFVLGAFIVTTHNVWTGPIAILVTLIGWGALIEGILMLAIRRNFLDFFAPMATHEKFMRFLGIFTVALGFLLIVSAIT